MKTTSALALALFLAAPAARGATLPSGFTEELVAEGLSSPTAMELAPDGRLFVCEQGGTLRVVENDVLLATPFVDLTVNSSGERGLLGVTLDPDFAGNHYVYVYYTATSPTIHNRLSRFTADGNVAVPGSEQILLDLNPLSSATNHNGGAIHFGGDGKLYIAVGENANGNNSQVFTNLLGKMLRINSDGSIPPDNPFLGSTTGNNRAIWALGLRNPFTFSFHRFSGRMFINDVGQVTWEEINDGIAGSNYGWPDHEGIANAPGFRDPLLAYGHGSGAAQGCAITGGAFYDPASAQFPGAYLDDYFFSDYCGDWIRRYDVATDSASGFASGIASPVDLKVSPDGSLYYLARGSGEVHRVIYTGTGAPNVTTQPQSQTVPVGQPASFSVTVTGSAPLSYQWRRNGANISGANTRSYTLASPQPADDGAAFSIVVSNTLGSATSNDAVLTVTSNDPPVGSIVDPAGGTLYRGGDVIGYSGSATDEEDGTLGGSAFTWHVDFHHGDHTHPFVLPTTGSTSGSFTIPTSGETAANVWYRIQLRVKDSDGLIHDSFRDVLPQVSTLTLATQPPGLQLRLDAQPVTSPFSFAGVEGILRSLGAPSPQVLSGSQWLFSSWSDAGAATHSISTPVDDTTYTAVYVQAPAGAFQFSAASYSRSEAGAAASFTVRRVGGAAGATSVTYATADGSAKAGEDYTATTGVLNFPAGALSRSVVVPLLRDTLVEGNETFGIDLSSPTGGALLGSPASAVVTLLDDDKGGSLSFSALSFSRSEAAPSAVVRVTRTGGMASGVTVDYATADGSATAGADYTTATGRLTFEAGITARSFAIPLLQDTAAEGTETVGLALTNPTGGAGLGVRAISTLRIVDDDHGGVLNFSATAYGVAESGASATITVQRTGGVASGVTVSYATADDTATEGQDYTLSTGTLTFDAGVTVQTFTIPILDDAVDEPNERLKLSLTAATGGAKIGMRPNAVLVIRDDEP